MSTALKTVLVIDDQEDARMIARAVLEHAGYVVIDAAGSLDGLREATERLPHAILIDLDMPAPDGIDTICVLRAIESTRQIPIIIYTGFDDLYRERLRACSFDGIARKPVIPSQLIDLLDGLLNRRAPAA